MTMFRGMLTAVATNAPPPEYVRRMAAHGFGVTVNEMVGPSRVRTLVEARQVTMAAVKEMCRLSFPAVGRLFGDRDHTTVMHACQRVRESERMRRTMEALCNEVRTQWSIDTGTMSAVVEFS